MSESAKDPQPSFLDKMSDDEVLNILGADGASLISRKTPQCPWVPTSTLEELDADPELQGDVKWVVDGLIPLGGMSIVFGSPKVGKSTLVANMAKCVAAGEPFAGKLTRPGDVLWLDLERHRRLTLRKFREENALHLEHRIHVYNGVAPTLDALATTIQRLKPVLVVIDSLSRQLMLEDENSAAEVTTKLAPFVAMTHDLNVALLPIHHARKSEGPHGSAMRGSSAFFGVSDVALEVKRMGEKVTDERRKLVSISCYDEANEELIVRRVDGGFAAEESPTVQRRKRVLAAIGTDKTTVDELAERLGIRRSTVQSDITALLAVDAVVCIGSGAKGSPYRYMAL